jgi:hypothetical protein
MISYFSLYAHDLFWLFLYSPIFIYSFICFNASLHSLLRHRYTLSLYIRDIYLIFLLIIPPPHCSPCAGHSFCLILLYIIYRYGYLD